MSVPTSLFEPAGNLHSLMRLVPKSLHEFSVMDGERHCRDWDCHVALPLVVDGVVVGNLRYCPDCGVSIESTGGHTVWLDHCGRYSGTGFDSD